jgi:hypothetical protein
MIIHSIVLSMAVKPSPDPEVRKKTVAVPNPDSWSDNKMAAELSKKGGAQEVQKWRERYQQQQAQKDFKREVCPSLLVCKCAAGPTYMCAAGPTCMCAAGPTCMCAAGPTCMCAAGPTYMCAAGPTCMSAAGPTCMCAAGPTCMCAATP